MAWYVYMNGILLLIYLTLSQFSAFASIIEAAKANADNSASTDEST
jgi:hypothetical protein